MGQTHARPLRAELAKGMRTERTADEMIWVYRVVDIFAAVMALTCFAALAWVVWSDFHGGEQSQ